MFDSRSYTVLFPLLIFSILDIALVSDTIRQKNNTPAGKTFFNFLLCVTVLQTTTFLAYGNEAHFLPMGTFLQTVITAVSIVLLTAVGYWWLIYMVVLIPSLAKWNTRRTKLLFGIPLFLLIAMTAVSPWTHWIFYVDANGVYQNGSLMPLQMMSYLYFTFGLILSLTEFRKATTSSRNMKRFTIYIIPGLLGGLANVLLYRGGYAQIGCSVGAILIYIEQFMEDVNESKRLRSIEVLNQKLLAANEEITAARDVADQANQAKSRFLFNMSHDIRTPMNAILGYTDIALRHFDDEAKARDCLMKIRDSGNHLLNLINDILEMSRIEAGRLEITDAPLDIREVIGTVGTMSEALALTKSINMKVVIGEIRHPYIYADELRINEVLINLLSNAVKYSNQGRNVEYRVNQISDAIDGKATFEFHIIDNGIGMSEEFQAHMFDSFSREHNTSVTKIEGTGLGLSIVKSIIDIMGGAISIRSKQNVGTTVVVTLSFRVMEDEAIRAFVEQKTSAQKEAKAQHALVGKRILYVEDNAINREIGIELLSEAEMAVDTAEDGSIAVQMIAQKGIHYYAAILMDIQMPVMNGYEAAEAIRKLPDSADIPIIALSANAFQEDVQKSLQSGMNAHLAKPIKPTELFQTLADCIR